MPDWTQKVCIKSTDSAGWNLSLGCHKVSVCVSMCVYKYTHTHTYEATKSGQMAKAEQNEAESRQNRGNPGWEG